MIGSIQPGCTAGGKGRNCGVKCKQQRSAPLASHPGGFARNSAHSPFQTPLQRQRRFAASLPVCQSAIIRLMLFHGSHTLTIVSNKQSRFYLASYIRVHRTWENEDSETATASPVRFFTKSYQALAIKLHLNCAFLEAFLKFGQSSHTELRI